MKTIFNFLSNDDGASMLEYGLLISLIAVVVIVGLEIFGLGVFDLMAGSSDSVVEAINSTSGGNTETN